MNNSLNKLILLSFLSLILCGCATSKNENIYKIDEGEIVEDNNKIADINYDDNTFEDNDNYDGTYQLIHSEYDDVLMGKASFRTDNGDKLINDIDFSDEIWYCLADIDNDSQDELFIKSRTETYVIDKREDNYYEAYVGKDYDIPINNGELSGILYYKIGAAPHHETYAFTTISESGEVEEVIHATWYDGNENDEKDEGDLFFLDRYEDIPVEKDLWLEKTSKYIELKDINVDWNKIQI